MHILHFSLILAKLPLWKHFRFVQHNKKTGDALLLYSLHHRHTTSVHITTRQYKLNAVRTSAAQNMWAQREPAVAHIHIVRCKKTALVTLANAKTVLLKRGRAADTTMSHLDQAAVHHQRPKHFITYSQWFIKRGKKGGLGWVGRLFRSSTRFSNANVRNDSCSRCITELKLRESEKQQD